ncbi:sodium-dependent multivitamin transporter-like isoform X2 [Octopus vulgaris]|uniref:Sodium-dependent multivitamin transporter-like isoform X2 n=1 Tax=Octopus vulgaris TaxID=6645 RepID=A0AA36EXQ1_OCTVU|nr:sodium-dependent multivitamin transporter-like isoform X2 [Octopus vulgaris]
MAIFLKVKSQFVFKPTISLLIEKYYFCNNNQTGGLRAVIWTDVFQSFVMYFCLLVAIIKGINEVGNLNDVWEISRETQRLDLDFRFDPFTRHTVFNLMFGYVLYAFGTVFNQSSFQRITVAKTPRTAAWVLMLAGPFYALTTGLAIFQGLLAFAYFKTKRCDPLEAGIISNPNQIMPYYMLMLFQNWRGMPGLFVAALFSACLSTMSSGLSSLSTITWIDIFQPMLKSPSEAKATFVCKAAVVIYGLMSLGVAVLVSNIGGTLTQIGDTLVSSFSGPLTGMILFGTLCPWANKKPRYTEVVFFILYYECSYCNSDRVCGWHHRQSNARKKFRSRAISTIKDEENMELDSKLERT